MPRWGGIQGRSATFRPKVRKMTKFPAGDGQNSKVPELKPKAVPPLVAIKRRGPGKSRVQAWAKIDSGKGTWKPK
jgi:hypothetical protein